MFVTMPALPEIEVLETVNLTDDASVSKQIIRRGTGPKPTNGQQVTTHYTGRLLDGTVFDSSVDRNSPFDFTLGTGQVIKAWDLCVASMDIGEKCRVTATAEYAYGKAGSPPTIPPNATLVFDLELLDAKEKEPNAWELSDEQKHERSVKKRGEGNALFTAGDYGKALESYLSAVRIWGEYGGESEVANRDKLPCHLNAAQCHLKLRQFRDAEKEASLALKLDDSNVKGLYRRGLARLALCEYAAAREDAQRILAIESNDSAKALLEKIDHDERAADQKERGLFQKMFA